MILQPLDERIIVQKVEEDELRGTILVSKSYSPNELHKGKVLASNVADVNVNDVIYFDIEQSKLIKIDQEEFYVVNWEGYYAIYG